MTMIEMTIMRIIKYEMTIMMIITGEWMSLQHKGG